MAARHYSSHNSPEGVGPDARISAAGYTFDWWAENIYYGGGTAGEAFGWWANSTGHRANMLSANFDELGIGLAFDARDQVWRWTTVFASPVS